MIESSCFSLPSFDDSLKRICTNLESLKLVSNSVVMARKRKLDGQESSGFYEFNQIQTAPATIRFSDNLLTKLEIRNLRTSEVNGLLFLLKTQANLKELDLKFVRLSYREPLLFDSSNFQHFKFHLVQFGFTTIVETNENVIDFINFQRNSLKHLEFGISSTQLIQH